MRVQTSKWFFFLAGIVFLFGCSTTKSVPAGDQLYTGASVELDVPSSVTARQKKTLRHDLTRLTRPRPNTRFLGIPFKLYLYNLFPNAKPESFFGRMRSRAGEPPVLFSELKLDNNVTQLRNFLENKGFFKATVTGDTTVKKKKASAEYKAVTGEQYMIAKVEFPKDSGDLEKAIRDISAKTLLKEGAPFDLDVIRGERERIDALLKERGFYYFSPDFLLIKADTTNGNNTVSLYMTIKEGIPTVSREIYHINDVFIYSNYRLNTAEADTNKAHAEFYKGYYIVDKENLYKLRLFEHAMQFKPGEVYNRTDHNQTLNRLMNLNVFKFVKNRFEPVTWLDSPMLNAYYYITPLPKKTLRAEITGTTKSNNFTGTEITFSLINRNFLRGGEQFSFSAFVGSEIQSSGAFSGYNTFRTGAEAGVSLPRFFIPLFDVRNEGAFTPRTNLKFGYDILNKQKLYTLNSFRGSYGYTWKENIRRNNELYPISINYVQPFNVTQAYKDSVLIRPELARATERQFILGSYYTFTYNDRLAGLVPLKSFFVNGVIDISGNIAGLATGANAKKGEVKEIFNAPFSQYLKIEGDARYYIKMGLHNTWANRIIVGFGMPYGNSLQLPYIKQFFSGGNNSIRAFRSRTVGPGAYHPVDRNWRYISDQTGDIKLEFNTELRPRISGPLYGALFFDAGNVWLYNDSVWTGKSQAQFTSKFLSQLAAGAGVGIRLDIELFVIRLDAAVPLRKPWESNPWVMSQVDFKDKFWRRENIVFNFAIGYPF